MTNTINLQKNWGNLPDILEQGVETLPQLLIHQARRFGNRVLHRKKDFGIWQRYTWNDVLEQVKTFAMGLASLGVTRGQTVAIVGENEPELFWSEYAAQAIGAKVVCLYPDLTPPQMEYVLIHSEAVIVICEGQEQVDKVLELEDKLRSIHRIIYWDDRGMWKYSHPKLMTFQQVQEMGKEYIRQHPETFEDEVAAGKGSNIAVLRYTSGTTGPPEGCIVTYDNLFDMMFRVTGTISLKPFTQYLSYNSPAWAAEQIFGLTIGLFVPFVVNFPEGQDTVLEDIREIGTEALALTPRQWESLASFVESKMKDAGPIRRWFYEWGMAVGSRNNLALLERKKVPLKWHLLYLLADKVLLYPLRHNLGLQAIYWAASAGTGIAPDVLRFFHSMGVKLRNSYGTTEIGLVAMHQGETYSLETVGKCFSVHPRFGPPLEYRITDEGELLVRGGSRFAGYYKDKEATAKKVNDDWFRTGDVVNITDKNELLYLDRLDDMRKLSTGYSYSPQSIDNRLRFSPFIKDAITIGDQDKPFVAALINIDTSALGSWAVRRRMSYTTFTELSQNSEVRKLIKIEIEKVNYFLPEESKVKRFISLPKEPDSDEGKLISSRKLWRGLLEQRYAELISAIYTGKTEVLVKVPVRYQEGRPRVHNAMVYINDLVQEGKGNQ